MFIKHSPCQIIIISTSIQFWHLLIVFSILVEIFLVVNRTSNFPLKSGHFGIWNSESHISTLLEQMPLTTFLLGEWHTALLASAEMGSSYYYSIDTTLSERGRRVSSLFCALPSLTQGSVAFLPLDCSESPDSTGPALISAHQEVWIMLRYYWLR